MAVTLIQAHDLYKFRYRLAMYYYGRKSMCDVFEWSYPGTYPIKVYLLSRPGYSNTQFKKDYNAQQRSKLELKDIEDIRRYDETLLYALLQLACGMPGRSDRVWTGEPYKGVPLAELPLEQLLYRLKQLRNDLAHDDQQFTIEVLNEKLEELEVLIEKIYEKTAIRFNKEDELDGKLSEVKEYVAGIKTLKIREKLENTDITQLAELQEEIQVFKEEIKHQIKQEGRVELCDLYMTLCLIDPAPWLHLNIRFKPSMAFIRLLLEEDTEKSGRPSQKQQVRQITVEGLLNVNCRDGSSPDIVVLSGEGGIGKTTLMQYVIEIWTDDPQALHLGSIEFLFYSHCRGSTISSFRQLLEHLLHKTYHRSNVSLQSFRDAVLESKTLIIIDGFDESNENSIKMVKDIISLAGVSMQVMLTTRPSSEKELLAIIPPGKRLLQLAVKGISKDQHSSFVSNLVDILIDDHDLNVTVKTSLIDKLTYFECELGENLNNPLTLTLLTLLWVECPENVDALDTTTELYYQIRKLLTSKLEERLLAKETQDPESKCKTFLKCHDDMALRAIKRKEFELEEDTVTTLKETCTDLGLPYQDVMSTYFVMKRSRRGLEFVDIWSYQHLRFQEYSAASSLVRRLIAHDQELQSSVTWPADRSVVTQNRNIIKLLLSEGCEGASSSWSQDCSTYQSVLLNITGILAMMKNQQLLNKYARDIVQLIQSSSCKLDLFLNHMVESKYNSEMIKEIAQAISDTRSWSSKGTHLKALPVLLDLITLEEVQLILNIDTDPDHCPGLHEALETLSQKDISISLMLLYQYHQGLNVSDKFLNIVNGKNCRLQQFVGRLSSVAITQLSATVEKLNLSCTIEDLPSLAAVLPRLQKLQKLGLRLKVVDHPCIDILPTLPYAGPNYALDLYGCSITDNDSNWCSDVVARLWPQSCPGILSVGVERVLRALHTRHLRVTGVGVFSHSNFSKDEVSRLHTLAQSCGIQEIQIWKA